MSGTAPPPRRVSDRTVKDVCSRHHPLSPFGLGALPFPVLSSARSVRIFCLSGHLLAYRYK